MPTSRNPVTISANEDMVTLLEIGAGEHRIDVEFASGTTGTAAMKETSNPNNSNAKSTIQVVAGTDLSLTGSGRFIIAGPTNIGMTIANLSGSIKISANRLS